jgi:hypothetical protein
VPNRISRLLDNLTPESRKQIRVAQAYVELFESEAGQIVLNDLAARHGVMRTSMFAGEGADKALHMAFAEGERNVVLGIVERMGLDFETYLERTSEEAET